MRFPIISRFAAHLDSTEDKYDVVIDGLNVALGTVGLSNKAKNNFEKGVRVGKGKRRKFFEPCKV